MDPCRRLKTSLTSEGGTSTPKLQCIKCAGPEECLAENGPNTSSLNPLTKQRQPVHFRTAIAQLLSAVEMMNKIGPRLKGRAAARTRGSYLGCMHNAKKSRAGQNAQGEAIHRPNSNYATCPVPGETRGTARKLLLRCMGRRRNRLDWHGQASSGGAGRKRCIVPGKPRCG